jgi:anti-sigma factor RsiW
VTCPESLRTQAYFDGEVDAPTAIVIETHLEGCAQCQALLGDLARARGEIRRAFTVVPDPGLLIRIRGAIDAEAGRTASHAPRDRRSWWQQSFWSGAFGGALAGAAAVAVLTFRLIPAPQELLVDSLVSEHVGSLLPGHLVGVESTDHHTVKPWFAGHADVSPVVADFSSQGYVLVGGRADYLSRQRAAVLVYRHGAHVINVFSWRARDGRAPMDTTRDGYRMAFWRSDGVQYCAISDTGWDELGQLRTLLQSVASSDPGGIRR